MDLLWVLIVGGFISCLSGNLIGRDVPGGVLGSIIAGFAEPSEDVNKESRKPIPSFISMG
uniref:hypothetical protein n=1 Tax=Paenibacillus sp. FSL K6-1122 TaxID=2954512 RepID=UPI00403F6AC9